MILVHPAGAVVPSVDALNDPALRQHDEALEEVKERKLSLPPLPDHAVSWVPHDLHLDLVPLAQLRRTRAGVPTVDAQPLDARHLGRGQVPLQVSPHHGLACWPA